MNRDEFFTNLSANEGRWMGIWDKPMPDFATESTLK